MKKKSIERRKRRAMELFLATSPFRTKVVESKKVYRREQIKREERKSWAA